MKKKTYANVLRTIRMIEDKGYDRKEAEQIALSIFEEHENGPMPIEFYVKKVLSKDDWLLEQEWRALGVI